MTNSWNVARLWVAGNDARPPLVHSGHLRASAVAQSSSPVEVQEAALRQRSEFNVNHPGFHVSLAIVFSNTLRLRETSPLDVMEKRGGLACQGMGIPGDYVLQGACAAR